MTHLTVRNVPSELAEALMAEKTRRGGSLNATVIGSAAPRARSRSGCIV